MSGRRFCSTTRRRPRPPLFPSTTLFRPQLDGTLALLANRGADADHCGDRCEHWLLCVEHQDGQIPGGGRRRLRSEEHTSELQSLTNIVCRLLPEKKNTKPHRPQGRDSVG